MNKEKVAMSEEIKNEVTEVMNDQSTVEKKIESIVFKTLKDRINGHIYVKMEDKKSDAEVDALYVNIESNRNYYTNRLSLPGDTFAMVSQSDSYAETLGLMIFDDFKKYIEGLFFTNGKPKKFEGNKRFNKKNA